MIEVKELTKRFEDKIVIENINTTFEPGKTNLIIGRSGAGKTVLLKCIIGLINPSSGSILFDGDDITQMEKEELRQLRSRMGMLFQGSALFDSMTVLDNVLFPLEVFSELSRMQRVERAMSFLERVGLEDARYKYPSAISGGMMKRAAIARAIALGPRYLFCDEPNSGLDPNTSIKIDELIHTITVEDNIITVINTHDMNSVRTIGDKIIYIRDGHKEWEGSGSQIGDSDNESLHHFVFASM